MAKKSKESTGDILRDLENKYGVGRLSPKQLTIVPTGSIQLDRAMKIGGTALGKIIEVFGMESSGKAQPLSSKILTPSGWISMGEVEIGTIISTPDGGNSTVIGVFPQGEQDVYKISFDDKTYTFCTLDHLWAVNTRGTFIGEVLSTKQLLEKNINRKNGCRKFKIPTINPIEFEQYGNITIDPYLLGILLGDGGFTSTNLKVTICEEGILNEVNRIIRKDYDDVILSNTMGKCGYSFRKKKRGGEKAEIWKQIIALGLDKKYSYEKHIPKEYLYTSIENRIALLQGLMDSDGSAESSSISYTSTSLQLSKDFEFLVRSLGCRCNTSSRVTKYESPTGNKVDGRVSYRSNVLINSLSIIPFRLKRKVDVFNDKKGEYSERFIESIILVGRENCQCIMIGHPDQLYITDDFIVTHNTTVTLHQMAEYQKAFPDKKVALIDYEYSFDMDYAAAIGVDVDNLLIYQPDTQEQGYDLVIALIEKEIVSCVVIDSQTAATPKATLEGEMGDSTMALQARLNSKFCLKVKGLLAVHKCTLFVISQLRDNIGSMSGESTITTGGKAFRFYSDIRWKIWKINDKDHELNKTTIDVIKSKVGKPFGSAKVNIIWGVGFDKIGEIIDYASEFRFIIKGGAGWYTIGEHKAQGLDGVKELFMEHPEIYEELHKQVITKLNGEELIDLETLTEEEEENESGL